MVDPPEGRNYELKDNLRKLPEVQHRKIRRCKISKSRQKIWRTAEKNPSLNRVPEGKS